MARTKANGTDERGTRSRMLLATSRLLQRQGYHATGLAQVLQEAAAPRGSMYFHFPGGKDQLAAEALRKSTAWVTRAIEAAFERGGGGFRRGLREFIEAYARQLEQSEFADGCPIATVTLEAATLPEELRAVCAAAYDEWHELFARRLRDESATPKRAAALATLVLAGIEGALVLSKARRTAAPLREVGAQLDAILPASARRPARRG